MGVRATQSFVAENVHWEFILKAEQKSAQCGCLEDEKKVTVSRRSRQKKKKVQNVNGTSSIALYGLGANYGAYRQRWFGIEFHHY